MEQLEEARAGLNRRVVFELVARVEIVAAGLERDYGDEGYEGRDMTFFQLGIRILGLTFFSILF